MTAKPSLFARWAEPFAILGVFIVMAFTYYTATNLSPATLPSGNPASVLGVSTQTGAEWKLIIPEQSEIFTQAKLDVKPEGAYQLTSTLNLTKVTEPFSQTALEITNHDNESKVYKIIPTITPNNGAVILRMRLQQTAITILSDKQVTPAQLTVPGHTGQVLHLELETLGPVTGPITLQINIEPL